MSAIQYYAWARRPKDHKVVQLKVKVIKGRTFQSWTGKTYKNNYEAAIDCERLNCK